MHADQQQILDDLILNFEDAYKNYLEVEGLHDNPVNTCGFYAMALILIDGDPIPDVLIQRKLVAHLTEVQHKASQNELDAIDLMVEEASRNRARAYVAG